MVGSVYKIEMEHICKSFDGVQALNDVSLYVKPGEIHALVGENGAGKSTLMKILSGALSADKGTIKVDGEIKNISNPMIGRNLGISVIYQEFMLANHLTVAENIYIDRIGENSRGFVNYKRLYKNTQQLLDKLGFGDISPTAKVGSISVAYQQVIEICKSLSRDAKILVLDEPTAVLTFEEIKKLFALLKELKAKGISIIYISHRLDEIFELCDCITVLKDGQLACDVETCNIDKNTLINRMVGRQVSTLYPTRHANIGEVVLSAEHLSIDHIEDVSFQVRKGEVLGFSGLIGSGRTEIMRALYGADKLKRGTVRYHDKPIRLKAPTDSVRNRIGYLSEDRKQKGVLLNLSIRENVTLSATRKVSRWGIIRHKREDTFVKDILRSLKTKYGSVADKTSSLSGGNQQKVSLAKWLAADCSVIILDEPTRGVDVGAKVEIYNNINDLAESGVAIIMISSEMTEIINMCDRAIVMRNGRVMGELQKDELSEQSLIAYAMGVTK